MYKLVGRLENEVFDLQLLKPRAEIKADEIKLEARHVSSLTLSHLINFALIMHYEVN